LVGIEKHIKPFLKNEERVHVLHTKEVVSGDEEPMRIVRTKKTSYLVLTAKVVNEKRENASISAVKSGELVVCVVFVVGRMKGIDRPALSTIVPTNDKRGFLLLNAGANVDVNAHNLLQYAIMGCNDSEKVRGIENPT